MTEKIINIHYDGNRKICSNDRNSFGYHWYIDSSYLQIFQKKTKIRHGKLFGRSNK